MGIDHSRYYGTPAGVDYLRCGAGEKTRLAVGADEDDFSTANSESTRAGPRIIYGVDISVDDDEIGLRLSLCMRNGAARCN